MLWVAHAVLYLRNLEGDQDRYRVWENLYLVDAVDEAEARAKAREEARHGEGKDVRLLEWGEAPPAEWVFAGFRKIRRTEYGSEPSLPGDELTFSEYEARSVEEIQALASDSASCMPCGRQECRPW